MITSKQMTTLTAHNFYDLAEHIAEEPDVMAKITLHPHSYIVWIIEEFLYSVSFKNWFLRFAFKFIPRRAIYQFADVVLNGISNGDVQNAIRRKREKDVHNKTTTEKD